MKAINNYVLIKKINEEVKTKSGLLLTGQESGDMRYGKGEVLSPGSLVNTVVAGDIIYYDKGRTHDVLIDGNWITVIREVDIVVAVDKKDQL
uniref:Co-chaperonin GroES n=1 Tax=uncultured virus TaxID=340016 RepID=A0A221S411_9VIRU|nr:co-chaperonin GroES [uncultured virus]